MKSMLFLTLAVMIGCSDSKNDSAEPDIPCPGNAIHIEVCIDCDDAGDCQETDYECRDICDADEDCQSGEVCLSSDDGNYCDVQDACN